MIVFPSCCPCQSSLTLLHKGLEALSASQDEVVDLGSVCGALMCNMYDMSVAGGANPYANTLALPRENNN